jgi:threonine dehydratase
LDQLTGSNLFFKCENFQKVGAFKFRGALNAVLSTPDNLIKHGVATHSSGNHAQALALAARMKGVRAYIVMPENAPVVKKEAVAGYGAEIIECPPTLESRESTLKQVVLKTGAHFVHPYNDYRIIAGQATCALELLEEIEDLDFIVAPIGGGGLLSGTALSASFFSPRTIVYGAEPEGADDACRSLHSGKIIPSEKPCTIADGLLTSLGDKTFPVIREHVKDILTVKDQEIIQAMKWIWERIKIVVEPSAAVPLAMVMKHKDLFEGKRIGIILSGGNVDLKRLPFSHMEIKLSI